MDVGPTPGSYILLVELEDPSSIDVGRLGRFDFPPGNYVYCGSALNGLEGRLRRHFSLEKRRRWHIDYLLERGRAVRAIVLPSDLRLECTLNRIVDRIPGSIEPARGFGSSDCRCRTHLHLLTDKGLEELNYMFEDLLLSPGKIPE
jgi:sugar fermentation stimulation protein A